MKEKKDDSDTGKNKTLSESYWKQVGQILVDRNFLSFIVTNFCHGFHKTFLNSFIAILCDQLVSDEDVPKSIRKTFYGGISLMSTVSYLTIFVIDLIYCI
jgi:hypothetical protein